MKKLLILKLCIVLLFALFISLVVLGQIYTSQLLTYFGFNVLHRSSRIDHVLYGADSTLQQG